MAPTTDDIIAAVLSGVEDERTRADGRIMLNACIDAIYGADRLPRVREALAGLCGGPWLDEVGAAVFLAPETIMDEIQRGQLHGAFRMGCAYLR